MYGKRVILSKTKDCKTKQNSGFEKILISVVMRLLNALNGWRAVGVWPTINYENKMPFPDKIAPCGSSIATAIIITSILVH